MRIAFQNGDRPEAAKRSAERPAVRGGGDARPAASATKGGVRAEIGRDRTRGCLPEREKGKSLIELQQEAGNVDVGVRQDYMTVMSHTMSQEDYAELEREGFHFQNMDPEEAVSIVDRIKAELARSGQEIQGYTDDLDLETLTAAVGSETLARALADSFRRADIPLTQENIERTMQAWVMASQLDQVSEGACGYMVEHGLAPEIWNYYLAQSSGADASGGNPMFYAEEIEGYYAQSAQAPEDEGLQEQIDQVIRQAGMEVNEESRQSAAFLLERGLPLTEETLRSFEEVRGVIFPVEEETFAEAAAAAVSEGKSPVHANLADRETVYEKAGRVLEYYRDDEEWSSLSDISARRLLEEIRLRMTAEVNVKLLKSGFAIDTAPMEQLLEALKQAEQEVADSYFPDDAQAVEKYRNFNETNRVVKELPALPVQTAGDYGMREEDLTLHQFHQEGKALQETYEKANESYEALMTEPRRDLGDSIRKAFANVDDILQDLDLEANEENRRAVRILGYNRMDMTPENVERVKEAYSQVCSVTEKMTPAAVLNMIRDGINPLEKSFAELDQYFSDSAGSYQESAESYSRFLYGMERQKEITAQERDAYIGIYRMLNRIEASDGAAVGALINSQAQLQFSNLLSAVRSSRFKGLNVKVEDSFGALERLVRKGDSITDQIARGFVRDMREALQEAAYSRESEGDYYRETLTQVREAALAEEDAVFLLQRGELPANAENLLAAQALLHGKENPFKTLREQTEEDSDRSNELWESLEDEDSFKEQYGQAIEEAQKHTKAASLEQADSSVDVRELRLAHRQLTIAGKLAAAEEYVLPMYIDGELTKVHLTLEHDGDRKGSIQISMALPRDGRIEAQLEAREGTVSGFLTGNAEAEVTKLARAADIFSDRMERMGMTVSGLPVAVEGAGNVFTKGGRSLQTSGGQRADLKDADLYGIAKEFLQAVKTAQEA